MDRTSKSASGLRTLFKTQWNLLSMKQFAGPQQKGRRKEETPGQRRKPEALPTGLLGALPLSCWPPTPASAPDEVHRASGLQGMQLEKLCSKSVNTSWNRSPSLGLPGLPNTKGKLRIHIPASLASPFSWGSIRCPPWTRKCQWEVAKAVHMQDNGHGRRL